MRRWNRFLLLLAFVLGAAAILGSTGSSQDQGQGGPNPLGIIVQPGELQVNIWVDKPVYYVNEYITVHYYVNKPAFVYIIDIDAAGQGRLIFPNRYSQDNYVSAGEHVLPDKPSYRFVVVPPTGTEYLQIIASTQPLNLDVQGFREAFPPLGTDPDQVGAQIQGIIPVGAETATAWTSFQVVGGGGPPPPPPPANQRPVASFTYSPYYPYVGQRVVFDASSSYDPDGWIVAYNWDFDSNGTVDATGRRASHVFYTAGSHPVTLTVYDNLGASGSVTYTVWVQGYAPPPPPPPSPPPANPGFYVTVEPGNILHIAVQGHPSWYTAHKYEIHLETNGSFLGVNQQGTGGAIPLGIVPTPTPQNTLDLSGSVSNGRVDYYIQVSSDATKIKFKLLLDYDGDGTLDRRTDDIYIGPTLRHPPSNPFVLYFPSGRLSWIGVQICIVLVDQPGFQFIVCFSYDS